MQDDMFLSKQEGRLNHLRGQKKYLTSQLNGINEEIQNIIKEGTSQIIGIGSNGDKTLLCTLPTGGAYIYRDYGTKELFAVDLDLISDAVQKLKLVRTDGR